MMTVNSSSSYWRASLPAWISIRVLEIRNSKDIFTINFLPHVESGVHVLVIKITSIYFQDLSAKLVHTKDYKYSETPSCGHCTDHEGVIESVGITIYGLSVLKCGLNLDKMWGLTFSRDMENYP